MQNHLKGVLLDTKSRIQSSQNKGAYVMKSETGTWQRLPF
jgi:hypothetical protein